MDIGAQRRPLVSLACCFLAIVASGCSVILGGNADPRPDLPGVIRPTVPPGAATWSAVDWQPVTFERPVKTSEEQWDQPNAVAAGPGGWVAVGSNDDVMGYEGRIWQSPDSLTWKLVARDQLAGLELVDVAATESAYVAIGTESSDLNNPTSTILRSIDGVTWVQATTVPGAWASHVAAGARGFVVVVEASGGNDLLFSADGRTWSRVTAREIGKDVVIADVAWEGNHWIAVGSALERAVVYRSVDGHAWVEEHLPASEPIQGVIDVSAYRVIPGRWATLVLGLDRGTSCAQDDEWCDKYQAAWSWTAESGWTRLSRSNWLLGRGYGVDAYAAGDAGFLYLLGDEVRTSRDGWEWTPIKESPPSYPLARDAVVTGDRVVAVGTPGSGDDLIGWFGSAVIHR